MVKRSRDKDYESIRGRKPLDAQAVKLLRMAMESMAWRLGCAEKSMRMMTTAEIRVQTRESGRKGQMWLNRLVDEIYQAVDMEATDAINRNTVPDVSKLMATLYAPIPLDSKDTI